MRRAWRSGELGLLRKGRLWNSRKLLGVALFVFGVGLTPRYQTVLSQC